MLINSFYSSNTLAIWKWMNLLNIKIHITDIERSLENHPDWPSILSISDTLNNLNIVTSVFKTESKEIPETKKPWLAILSRADQTLAIVVTQGNDSVEIYDRSCKNKDIITVDKFLNEWTGVYMLAEPEKYDKKPEYRKTQIKDVQSKLMIGMLIGSIISIMSILFYKQVSTFQGLEFLQYVILYIFYFIGLILSSTILWYELDKNNKVLNNVCNGLVKTNCSAILSSKGSRLFNRYSWSEIGFTYFFGAIILVLLPLEFSIIKVWFFILGILACFYPIYSLYYQWKIVKQWCILCIGVQVVLIFQGTLMFLNKSDYDLSLFFSIKPNVIAIIAFAYLIPFSAWNIFKNRILYVQKLKNDSMHFRKLKFNIKIFSTLLMSQRKVDMIDNQYGIILGNSQSKNKIIKVCNPYCKPCSISHLKIKELINKVDDLCVQIIFLTPENDSHQITQTVKYLLSLNKRDKENILIENALDYWYSGDEKDFELFSKVFPLEFSINDSDKEIKLMREWCTQNNVQYTPTIYFNGFELPKEYDLRDLDYLIREYSEYINL